MKIDILPPFKRVLPLVDLPIRLSIASENETEATYLMGLKSKLEKYTIRSGVEIARKKTPMPERYRELHRLK